MYNIIQKYASNVVKNFIKRSIVDFKYPFAVLSSVQENPFHIFSTITHHSPVVKDILFLRKKYIPRREIFYKASTLGSELLLNNILSGTNTASFHTSVSQLTNQIEELRSTHPVISINDNQQLALLNNTLNTSQQHWANLNFHKNIRTIPSRLTKMDVTGQNDLPNSVITQIKLPQPSVDYESLEKPTSPKLGRRQFLQLLVSNSIGTEAVNSTRNRELTRLPAVLLHIANKLESPSLKAKVVDLIQFHSPGIYVALNKN